VEAEKTALKEIQVLWIFSIHPPSEVQQQLMENPLEKGQVGSATLIAIILEHMDRCPGMHWGIDVAERPFIRRQLAVRVHQPSLAKQQELLLGEIRIDQRKCNAMKGEVPGCEPGIFPLVRHRHNIGGHEVTPIPVAAEFPVLGRWRLSRVTIKPALHIETVKLLVPQHSGEGLTLYASHV